jgi:protein ImuB
MEGQMQAQEIFVVLHKWGIHTLGQLAALDKEDLRNRLGSEAVRLWERANGTATRLLKFVRPPESFEESFEFENEIETAEPLLFVLRRFLEQLALRLSAIYLIAKELTLRITFANKQTYERVFKIPQPTSNVDLLFRMLQTHLEIFRSEHPIAAVALSAQPIRPVSQQFGLFETALRNPHQLYETLARLVALLGHDRVGTPVLDETHRPDAFRMEPFSGTGFQSATGRIRRGEPVGEAGVSSCEVLGRQDARRPHSQDGRATMPALRRFRPATPAIILSEEQKPAHVRSSEIQAKVIEQRGPYLLSGNWWDEKSWARAEWDLQLENRELIHAYETPPSSHYGATGEGTWNVEGIYD